jgi:pimeloyl-ACP methyl ester carboxylesterase
VRTVPSSRGVSIVVHDLSDARDPTHELEPLLLTHATGFHGRVWQPVADHLRDHHAFAPDLRGHGDATPPGDGDFAWDGFADDVLAVVDALGLTDVVSAGHSKGGAALLLAEARRPGTFRALYLYEPVVMPSDWQPSTARANPLAEGALRRRPVFDSRDAAYENFAGKPPFSSLDPVALRAYVDHGFADEPDGTVRLKCEPEHESQVYRMGPQHRAYDELDRVRCPVTIARGALDAFGPAAFAEPIVEHLPNGRLEAFDDLGHFGPLEAPARLAAAIEGALGTAANDPSAGLPRADVPRAQ